MDRTPRNGFRAAVYRGDYIDTFKGRIEKVIAGKSTETSTVRVHHARERQARHLLSRSACEHTFSRPAVLLSRLCTSITNAVNEHEHRRLGMGNLLDEEGMGMVVDRVPRNASGMSDLPSHLTVFYRLRWTYMGCALACSLVCALRWSLLSCMAL